MRPGECNEKTEEAGVRIEPDEEEDEEEEEIERGSEASEGRWICKVANELENGSVGSGSR